jgi:hypothetical protein
MILSKICFKKFFFVAVKNALTQKVTCHLQAVGLFQAAFQVINRIVKTSYFETTHKTSNAAIFTC